MNNEDLITYKGKSMLSDPRPAQFKEIVPKCEMTSAATVAEPAKTAPRAAAVPPAGQWKKRGKNPARHARAHV